MSLYARTALSALVAASLVGAPVLAQSAPGAADVVVNMRAVEISDVAEQISRITGRTLILDPAVKGTVNVTSAEPLSVDGTEPGERAVRLRRQSDGHFSARADVNGRTIKLLVDTGASTVVLKATDAEKAGIDVGSLSFSVAVDTANGVAYAAPVRLRTVGVGPIAVGDVEALVAKPGSLKESLLGMSFLKRLRSYEFSGDFLTIRG